MKEYILTDKENIRIKVELNEYKKTIWTRLLKSSNNINSIF